MIRLRASTSHGFTVVELVVVIIILAVLAAVAAPRFVDLSTQARTTTVKAFAGAVQAAATSVHTACLAGVNGCNATLQNEVSTLAGQLLQLNYGWPDAGDNLGNYQIDMMVTYTGFTAAIPTTATTRFSLDGSPDPTRCAVTYTDAYTRGATLGIDVSTDTSGC